jgi:pimeloyl-ACP methyl ester carboxylesterase
MRFARQGSLAGVLAGLLFMAPFARAIDLDLMTPPGRYVSVDTHRLHYYCVGDGTPTVVIDGGIGSAAVEWRAIQTALSGRTRVCSYDRAGYGWSDPGPAPRSTSRVVKEMREMLQEARIPPPYLLVGHSFGGFNVRYFAANFPDEVLGLVLLESSHPAAAMPRDKKSVAGRNPFPAQVATEGRAESDDFAVAGYLNSRRKAIFAQMDEISSFARSAREVEASPALASIPIIVVARDPARGFPDPAEESSWQQGQHELAELSPQGRFVTAKGSGHEIYADRPDVVVAEISALLDLLAIPSAPENPK